MPLTTFIPNANGSSTSGCQYMFVAPGRLTTAEYVSNVAVDDIRNILTRLITSSESATLESTKGFS